MDPCRASDPARNRCSQAAGARQSACNRLRRQVLPVGRRRKKPLLDGRDGDWGHRSAWPRRAIIAHTCRRPRPASKLTEYNVPCEKVHLIRCTKCTGYSGELFGCSCAPHCRAPHYRARCYRITAAIPPAPSVLAEASATSKSRGGYTPRNSVATTATASVKLSAGDGVGCEPAISFFRYMKTTTRT